MKALMGVNIGGRFVIRRSLRWHGNRDYAHRPKELRPEHRLRYYVTPGGEKYYLEILDNASWKILDYTTRIADMLLQMQHGNCRASVEQRGSGHPLEQHLNQLFQLEYGNQQSRRHAFRLIPLSSELARDGAKTKSK